jgi:hypothetical protein
MAALSDTERTARVRRLGQASALIVAPWGFVIANGGDAWMTRHGGSDMTSRGALAIAAAHSSLDRWASLAAMVGSLLLIPAVLGAMSLLRLRAARLGLAGGVMVIAGYVCYFALVFQGYTTNAMAERGRHMADYAAVLDLANNQGFTIWVSLLFVLGNLIGTILLGLALLRSRIIPVWAGLCIMGWPVFHIFGGGLGEVAGAVLEAVGLAMVALRLLNVPVSEASEPPLAARH